MALETEEKIPAKPATANKKEDTGVKSSSGTDSKLATGVNNENVTKKKGKGAKNGNKSGNALTNGHTSDEVTNASDTKAPTAASEKEKEKEKEDEKEKDNAADDRSEESIDFDLLHDNGITVHIQSPGAELLSIQLSSMELVQEIHQLLMDREDTCHRTCFSLQLDGVTLDNFAELKNIEGLKHNSTIKVVEEPYTMREARIHVRHVRDLLKSMDFADAYYGVDCNSLSFLHTITQGDLLEKKKSRPDSVDCTPPDYIMPGSKERPLLPLHPGVKTSKSPQALKVLTTSAWNPPPGHRKLHGDLMYMYVVTMEDKRFHISACPKGFYINQSTEEVFNPKPDNPSHLCHSLIDLLSQISPSFKRVFSQMQKKRTLRHAFERVATPYQVYAWCSPQLEHTIDAIRAEDAFSSKLGYEEHIPGQTRDWNEELQTTRELPRKTLPDRLLRERAMFKVHGDFLIAATRGAMAVIDGNVLAINPGEDAKMQMFIWNNIFFSLGFDVRDHYKELGGDVAAFVAPRNDLHGVRVYNIVDIEGLYTLGTAVIDYRGYRVTAQSIIPGILEREQEQSVVYGSIDFGKTVLSHPKYMELLRKAAKQLNIFPHSVFNEKNERVDLCSSVECKGIIGNDGRHYILDLLRTFPSDVNFLKIEGEEPSPELKAMGFPIEHKHKLSCLRQELLEAFFTESYMNFIRHAAPGMRRIGYMCKISKKTESTTQTADNKNQLTEDQAIADSENQTKTKTDDEPVPDIEIVKVPTPDELTADGIEKLYNGIDLSDAANFNQANQVIKEACEAVGSLQPYKFDFRFNPDVYSPGIKHCTNESISLKKQRKLVRDAAEFLVLKQIPAFIEAHMDHLSNSIDGPNLTEALHVRGINIRYLGKVAQQLAKVPRLEYLYRIAVQELIVRAAKHIYYNYMQNTEVMSLASAISHFLNCLLTSGPVSPPALGSDELQKTNKRRNKRKNGKNALLGSDNNDWALITPKSMWQQIKREIKAYWDFDLDCDLSAVDRSYIDAYKLQKISVLRAFCLKVGIQILLREYNFESRNKPTFTDEDIVNVFPIVKHVNPRATDAYNFYTTAQTKIEQGYFKEGYELISEALNLLNNVFGAMHVENGQCLRMLARLSYMLRDPQEALAIQQRSVIMSERVNGIDHPYTILEYTHLALFCFANGQISTSLKLLYRARYLFLLAFGEDHPQVALIDSNISLILHAVGEYELSLRFIEHALALNLKYHGEKSENVAVSYHLVARTQSCMGDFRSALSNEKETYTIYKTQLGENHEKTQESSQCLQLLTQQAVVLQKKMNDIYSNGKLTTGLPPIQIQPPTMGSVLDMLNVINGIVLVQISYLSYHSQQDIAKVRTEIEKHLRESEQNETADTLKKLTVINDEETEASKNKQKLTNGDVVAATKTSINNIESKAEPQPNANATSPQPHPSDVAVNS